MPTKPPFPEDPKSEEPEFVDEPDLPASEPSAVPTGTPVRRALPPEPMTGAQRSYLKSLCEIAGQPFDDSLTKAQASRRIDELHRLTRQDSEPAVGRDVTATGAARPGAAKATK